MAAWYEDFAKAMDPQPADVATLFAGARAAIPVYALMGATGLNEGEDAELLKRLGPLPKPSMPQLSEDDQQSRMIADFERQFPTPELRRAALQHMRAVKANKAYDPGTATRRVDFMPHNAETYAGPEMRATPPKARNTDLMRAPVPKRAFAGGGSAKKTVQQMADELLMKGTKVADKPNLARRSLFGLKAQPAMDFPLAKIDDKALTKLEKEFGKEGKAPTLTEKTTTVSPDAGATKSTLKSITETPVSRRTVLKSAAGQAMQGVLPQGVLPTPSVAGLVESAAPAAISADMMPGLVMAAIKQGMPKKEAIEFVQSQLSGAKPTKAFDPSGNEFQIERMYEHLTDPEYAPNDWEFFGPMRPSGALNVMLGTPDSNVPPMQLRGALRQIKEADPQRYRQMMNSAKDFSMGSYETTLESGMMTPKDLEKYARGEHAEPKYRPENLWNND